MRQLINTVLLLCSTAAVAAGQSILDVPANGNLQQAIDVAQPGDTITLEPGALYTGNFVLPNKTGNGWITITTAGADPLEGSRITPQTAASLAKIMAPNDSPAISTPRARTTTG